MDERAGICRRSATASPRRCAAASVAHAHSGVPTASATAGSAAPAPPATCPRASACPPPRLPGTGAAHLTGMKLASTRPAATCGASSAAIPFKQDHIMALTTSS